MSERTVIIGGAGIGALSAGCYTAMNSDRVPIFEQYILHLQRLDGAARATMRPCLVWSGRSSMS